MTEYTQRLANAETHKRLFSNLQSKYLLDLGDRLMVAGTKDEGEYLEIWDKQSDAEESLAKMRARFPSIDFGVIKKTQLVLIILFLSDNRDISVKWHFADGQLLLYPSEVFLRVAGDMISHVEREAECIMHPSLRDHTIQLLEDMTRLGAYLSPSDLECPVDCPSCGCTFTIYEPVYRAWRDGDIESVNCKVCGTEFKEAPFFRSSCARCKKESGFMPPGMLASFTPQNPFVCVSCHAVMFTEKIQTNSQKKVPTVKPDQSGCLILIATLVSGLMTIVCMVIMWSVRR